MASVAKDAELAEVIVQATMGGEGFHAKGTAVLKENWLEIFPWYKQSENELPSFQEGQVFKPSELKMNEGETAAP